MSALLRLLAALALVTAAGCAGTGGSPPRVVVTTDILGDVTRAVVGDQAEVSVLMKPDSDPHSFGVSAQEAALIESAGLIVGNGLGLEEGVLRNVEAARRAGVPVLAVAERTDPITFTADETAGRPDPHFWTDPRRVATAVDLIAEQVVAHVDGVDAAAVRASAAAYRREVERLDAWVGGQVATVPPEARRLVTNHHVFGYFARRYGFEVVGAVIPSGTTLASPSASDLKSLSDAIRRTGVKAIFADSAQPDRLARVLASEAGVDVKVVPLFSESLSRRSPGAATYLEMVRSNTKAMVDGLNGR
ncbi:zinc ABC transporter substrate-binding protein [Nonomuraea sp. MG754425]|uniref:zinc ABC transporter substrate-binding protein AztC n=1 Tax=Nonomuraea sp. MG754425 TaxID=2570319 RepID=UPI001F3A30C7|nr:zinc ABC transporter substrate-binding protein AztC [Nonomuraea sp. MG754425]MCF6470144.1 zinc ABC transporter substrate-binding protein [Nonomuraea sp. MG754425]